MTRKRDPRAGFRSTDLGDICYPDLTVQHDGEVMMEISPILDANGERIVRHFQSYRQGFTGFIRPSWAGDFDPVTDEVSGG